MQLKDKVAIVTGSSRGIGKAIALKLAEEGAKVVINYKSSKSEAEKVAEIIGAPTSLVVQADITNESDIKNLVKTTINHFGAIDILVNNAGEILRPGDWKMDLNTWHRSIDTNVTGAWMMIREIAPIMLEKKQGVILNISSTFGFIGAAPVIAYTTAKAGVINLTKSFAKEFAPHLRVNAITPGIIMTDMTTAAGEELIEQFRLETPLKRIGAPEEIAKAALFLVSDNASFITGEILVVDGGHSLR